MDKLQEEIREKILQDITASDVLEFRKKPYTKKDFPRTELFNKLWYSLERELNWREHKLIEDMRHLLDCFEEDRNTKELSDGVLRLQNIGDLRNTERDILQDICLDLLG